MAAQGSVLSGRTVWSGFCRLPFMPSTVIDHYSYKPESEILKVTFISGSVYEYTGVPEQLYRQLLASRSKGKFLNENIKGKYPFKKVNSTRQN
jgi:hypothetical protein